MKIKCIRCGFNTTVESKDIEIDIYKNLLSEKRVVVKFYYQTFCDSCAEIVSGVIRKEYSISEFEKLCGVK